MSTQPTAGAVRAAKRLREELALDSPIEWLAEQIDRETGAKELADLLQQMLFAIENADETGYVTDVGFLDLDDLRAKARAALARYNGGTK